MRALRERAMVSLRSAPSLPKHVRIQFDPVRQAFAVLSPERVFWPNDISLDILRRCDGGSTVRQIIADLAAEYDADEAGCDRRRHRLPAGMVRQAAGEAMNEPLLPPIGMLAELTHRCPLQCPYCSNPIELLKANRELDTETWLDLFDQAADLGVLQVHLSGGEPTLRRDLEQLVAGLSARGVYTNLITAGVGIAEGRIEAFAEAGLDHLQLSFQGARPSHHRSYRQPCRQP